MPKASNYMSFFLPASHVSFPERAICSPTICVVLFVVFQPVTMYLNGEYVKGYDLLPLVAMIYIYIEREICIYIYI